MEMGARARRRRQRQRRRALLLSAKRVCISDRNFFFHFFYVRFAVNVPNRTEWMNEKEIYLHEIRPMASHTSWNLYVSNVSKTWTFLNPLLFIFSFVASRCRYLRLRLCISERIKKKIIFGMWNADGPDVRIKYDIAMLPKINENSAVQWLCAVGCNSLLAAHLPFTILVYGHWHHRIASHRIVAASPGNTHRGREIKLIL